MLKSDATSIQHLNPDKSDIKYHSKPSGQCRGTSVGWPLAFVRLLHVGRVEHVIAEVKKHATTGGRWRGSYELTQAAAKILAHMTTLQERTKGPRCGAFGALAALWLHHPNCTGVDALGICQYPR